MVPDFQAFRRPHRRCGLWLLLAGVLFPAALAVATYPYQWAHDSPLVAHALGAVGGRTYSNSLEAFQASYAKGFRAFEADLSLTTDNQLVAIHDWTTQTMNLLEIPMVPGREGLAFSLAGFKRVKIFKKYTPLSFRDLAGLMVQYPGVTVITDIKILTAPEVRTAYGSLIADARQAGAGVLDRIAPHVSNQEMVDALDALYPFKTKIFTLYGSTYNYKDRMVFAEKNGLRVISMAAYEATPPFLSELRAGGYYSYVYGEDDLTKIKQLRALGAYGFYVDFLGPHALDSASRLWRGYF